MLDRRQRGRELRRRALLQVRLHHQLRDRARARAARRRDSCRSAARSSTGRATTCSGAFVGSEGTLGVATKIWLRVIPAPESGAHARRLLQHTATRGRPCRRRLGRDRPGAMEMMDRLAIEAAEGGHARRLSHGRRSGAGGRARRRRGRVPGRFDEVVEVCEGRGDRRPGRPGRGRAGAHLARAQGGVRGDGADRAQLLRPGQRHPAHPAPGGPAPYRRARRRVRAEGRQRLSRRRREPAPAGALRRRRRRASPSGPRSWPG